MCVCVWKPRERRNCSVFSFFWVLLSPLFFLFLCYLCLLTYCIYILFLFCFCHCNLYQQSRCLNNANPFFIQSRVQFFYPHHNCLLPQRNSWELGDKAQTRCVWWWSQTRIQRAIIQQSHTPRCTIIYSNGTLWRTLRGLSQLCSLHFTKKNFFGSDYVAFFSPINDINSTACW